MDRLISLCILLFAGYWTYQGWFTYGFWEGTTPGPGFLPFLIGLATMILAIIGLFKQSPAAFKVQKKHFIPVIGALIMILAIQLFGMIVSSGLFIIIWLLWVEKFTVKKATILGVSTTLLIYILFSSVLKIPFPQGIFGI